VEFLKRSSELGVGVLDYGDTIAYEGMLDDVLLIAGATLKGLVNVVEGNYDIVYQPYGGLHHARRDRAAGFCPINDIALAIEYARKFYNVRKIAVIDVDVHHGDGTQDMYYGVSDVLCISIHMRAPWFYPGTGDVNELGVGEGYGYSVNVPLPPGTGDEAYQYVFSELIPKVIKKFKPNLIIAQLGVDTHKDDLLGGLKLTTNTYRFIAEKLKSLVKELKIPLLSLGGGGYGPRAAEAMISYLVGFMEEPNSIRDEVFRRLMEEPTRDSKETIDYVRSIISRILSIEWIKDP